MRLDWTFGLILVVLVAIVESIPSFEYGMVNSISANNFNDVLKAHEVAMVKFYTPKCTHCQTISPVFEDAAKRLKEKNVMMFELNCAENYENNDLCRNHDIQGYPTLKSFFRDESFEEFNSHDMNMIVDYMTR